MNRKAEIKFVFVKAKLPQILDEHLGNFIDIIFNVVWLLTKFMLFSKAKSSNSSSSTWNEYREVRV